MADLIKRLRPDLDATGLPWTLKPGKKHQKLFLNGRLVSVLPLVGKGSEIDRRGFENTRAQIRRAAREARS